VSVEGGVAARGADLRALLAIHVALTAGADRDYLCAVLRGQARATL